MVEQRRDELVACLKPAEPEQIKAMITGLKTLLPSPATDRFSVEAEVKLTLATLGRFPAWAVSRACRKFADGAIPRKSTFCPTTAELVPACEAEMVEVRGELARIDKILTAEVYSEPTEDEAHRAEVVARLIGKVGKSWGIKKERAEPEPTDPKAECMAVLGLSAEEFAKLPNRKGE